MKINVEFSSLADMANFTKFINDSLVPPTQKQVTITDLNKKLNELVTDKKRLEDLLDRAYTRIRMADPDGKTANVEELKTIHNIPKNVLEASISDLDLTMRAFNCLAAENVYTIGKLIQHSEYDLIKFPNLGRKSLKEIKEQLYDKFKLTLALR